MDQNSLFDILQRLYYLEKEFSKAFEVLLKMKSGKVFDFFSVNYPTF